MVAAIGAALFAQDFDAAWSTLFSTLVARVTDNSKDLNILVEVPPELLVLIISLLTLRDLLALARSCTGLHRFVNGELKKSLKKMVHGASAFVFEPEQYPSPNLLVRPSTLAIGTFTYGGSHEFDLRLFRTDYTLNEQQVLDLPFDARQWYTLLRMLFLPILKDDKGLPAYYGPLAYVDNSQMSDVKYPFKSRIIFDFVDEDPVVQRDLLATLREPVNSRIVEEVKHIVAFYRNFRLYSLDYTILHGKDVFAPGLSCATPPVLHSFLKVMRVVDESDLVDKDRLVKVMDLAPAIVTPSLATLICSLAPSQKTVGVLATLAFKAMQVDHKNFSFDMVMEILSKEKSFDINVPFADLSALSILLRIQEGVVQPEVMRFYIARGMFVITKPDDFNANHDELVQGLLARGHGALLHYMLTCNGNKKNVMILSVSYRREVINRFRDLSDLFRKHTVSSASCKRCIDLTGEIIDLTDKSTEENEIDNSCGEAADHNPKKRKRSEDGNDDGDGDGEHESKRSR